MDFNRTHYRTLFALHRCISYFDSVKKIKSSYLTMFYGPEWIEFCTITTPGDETKVLYIDNFLPIHTLLEMKA